tara:strand:- start:274 stop:894 length:621 start_codon:yes stop_codon:yes gene_type:complete
VTSDPIGRLAGTLKLRDFDDPDDAAQVFDFCKRLVAWWEWQEKHIKNGEAVSSKFDNMLAEDGILASTFHTLLLYLAKIDPHYFNLAKRIAAATLVNLERPDRVHLLIAAQLLTTEPPSKPNKAARDIPLIIGIAVGQMIGLKPTGATKNGGSGRMQSHLKNDHNVNISFDTLLDVWKNRKTKLAGGGFEQREILEFLNSVSPMQE